MDKWTMIILEAEDMWACSAEARYYATIDLADGEYKVARDSFKARRIYDLYGYDYFLRFIDRCPHVKFLAQEYLPCDRLPGAQCTLFCANYKGGCTNANV